MKRTFQPSNRKKETNTVSEKECLQPAVEQFLQKEEQKAERD